MTFTSGNCLLKPATVAFSDEAAMFQLQIVISPDCAKAGPEPRASASAAQVNFMRIEILPFHLLSPERWLD